MTAVQAPIRTEPAVRIERVTKTFPLGKTSVTALSEVSLALGQGEFLCIVGASGCGKSTLLNLIAGLDQPTAGQVRIGGRRVALMFQDPTLFPWLTVGRNVDLALKLRGMDRRDRPARVAELLRLVRLAGLEDRRPHELSGGMRQRVALARVLAQDADIVLMDEPFGALDAMTRDAMHDELERIWSELGLTVVFVTHNVREAVRLGDRIILMSSSPGRVKSEYAVTLDRPRHLDDAPVAEMAGRLTADLRAEVARHVG
ncbi:ABC transporter ATP-binding protein [soil metagenome]